MTTHYNTTGASFGSPKGSEKYNEALKILRKQLECAKGIGATAILVVPNLDLDVGYKNSIENTIETFRELEDEIKEAGIHIGLENIWNRFFLSPYDAKYVIESINNPLVGIYLDIGNVLETSLPDFWIEVLAPYIKRVHVKDFKRNNSFFSGGTFCELLEGDLDFKTVIPKLKAAGYDGPLTSEVGNDKEGRSRDEFLADLSREMDQIVAMAN
jgi:hexulose-6-phosphate isomerase